MTSHCCGQKIESPTSQDSLDPLIVLNGQIINVLCGSRLDEIDLLSELQLRFPDSGWSTTTLYDLLIIGRRKGRFCLTSEALWAVRCDMALRNPVENSPYVNDCALIIPASCCPQSCIKETFCGCSKLAIQ